MALPEKINQLGVSAFGQQTGELHHGAHYEFSYTGQIPVSLTMPIQTAAYKHGELHPVFAQHLPEGYVRRYISERLSRYAKVNDMYFLGLQGAKGIGHLAYHSTIEQSLPEQLSLNDILKWNEPESLFHSLLERYYLHGLAAGIQPKVLVPAFKISASSKTTLQQSEFIVKTFDDEFDLLTVNEFVCMQAAKACGLNPPNCWLSDDLKSFVIERFDIQNGSKLAVEDFSVLMGKSGDEKYSSSYESVLKATRIYTQSQAQVNKAYQYIVFNCLIGNGDAHLKNFALQYKQTRETVTLTPPYDITHTIIYPTIDNKMALKLSKTKLFPTIEQLTKLGEQYGVANSKQQVIKIADLLSDYLATASAPALMSGLKTSLEKSLALAKTGIYSVKSYPHDKNRKFD